jgi:xylulose-5-phosphate/fructose-6-phosphate phosphoketolase
MVVLNDLDRFHLASDVIDRVPALRSRAAYAQQAIRERLIEHKQYIAKYGEDLPEVRQWTWGQPVAGTRPRRGSRASSRGKPA